MPRKDFLADVSSASGKAIANVTDLERGDDDGDVNFVFTPPSGEPIIIGLLALDVSGYPSENTFMIFTKSPEVPARVNSALEDVASFSAGMRVIELVQTITSKLQIVLATESKAIPLTIDSDVEMFDSINDDEDNQEDDDEEYDYDDAYNDGFFDDGFEPYGLSDGKRSSVSRFSLAPEAASRLSRRIKTDLRAVKFSTFKIGVLSGMTADAPTCLLSISIQASKLGLSEEALHAWDLEPVQYIVLLLRYSSGYKTFESIISEPAKSLDISFRIGVCDKYKPTVSQALAAFSDVTKEKTYLEGNNTVPVATPVVGSGSFSSIFISSSMDNFINEQFVSLLKIRHNMGLGWDGAKLYFNDRVGRSEDNSTDLPQIYYEESTPKQSSLPPMMYADHLTEDQVKEVSFPLVAAQFVMRYLLRCTEFCLVCHDKIEDDFEALKPYVCNKPLCLYQYMSLGFGPSIEHEIMSQPYVVDLLVSFCYAAALNRRIREYPTGMSLAVPPKGSYVATQPAPVARYMVTAPKPQVVEPPASTIDVRFDQARQELIFDGELCPIRNGDWILLLCGSLSLHFRVEDVSLYPTVKLSETLITAGNNVAPTEATLATPATTPPPTTLVPAKMAKYDQNFDDLENVHKAETIVMLLETLPSINELRTYLLQQGRYTVPNLRMWKDRISPAALGLLRWVIASNRSSIIQVDKCPGQEELDPSLAAKVRLDQKCANIPEGWVQFRFAQGSPDKEQRFLNALKTEQASLNSNYPTLFAWHGSPLHNWHSIIRHGLDFSETLHGRAYGNGVYHALSQNTSVAYTAGHASLSWPGSELNFKSAMSLNEIVNCTSKYQSINPHLVVQFVDWIQCRYLMVQNMANAYGGPTTTDAGAILETYVEQDPKFTVTSTLGQAVGIPLCAVSISKSFRTRTKSLDSTSNISNKRRKGLSGNMGLLVGADSDEEDIEDINFLFSDEEHTPTINDNNKGTVKAASQNLLTDFVAGSLDQSSLPMLEPPEYATTSASLRLTRELKTVLKIQELTPLHELGWYINPDLVSNVYQWIVELHSFEESLPLAKDMKAAGITSIVLEIRFGKEFPHSPPFVRVIRPRFLPFTSGGGGHVTGGGAMCMELLTNTGWSAVSSIESVLLQVRLAIMNLEPKPARLMLLGNHLGGGKGQDYSTGEAVAAYIRACQAHGWEVPKDFKDFGGGGIY